MFINTFVRSNRRWFTVRHELVAQYGNGAESILADLGPFQNVESAYQFWLRQWQQFANENAHAKARYLYQFRDWQIRAMEEAEIRKAQEQREEREKRRRKRQAFRPRRRPRHSPGEAHYLVLGLAPGATQDEICSAFRNKVKTHHPDVGGKPEDFIRIRQATKH